MLKLRALSKKAAHFFFSQAFSQSGMSLGVQHLVVVVPGGPVEEICIRRSLVLMCLSWSSLDVI